MQIGSSDEQRENADSPSIGTRLLLSSATSERRSRGEQQHFEMVLMNEGKPNRSLQ
jgi:hypothetical protein